METAKKGMAFVRPGVYEEKTDSGVTYREYFVGEIIADRRKQLKMSQQELADKVGVNRSTISRYESGTYKKISYKMLGQIAEALDMTEDYMWAITDDPHEALERAEHDEQTKGIMAFNDFVAKDERVEKVIVPVRDGISIIKMKN